MQKSCAIKNTAARPACPIFLSQTGSNTTLGSLELNAFGLRTSLVQWEIAKPTVTLLVRVVLEILEIFNSCNKL